MPNLLEEKEKKSLTEIKKSLANPSLTDDLDPLTNQEVQNLQADRELKKRYANWFIWILIVQLFFMNFIFIAVGFGGLKFDKWTLELYVTSTILEVFGVVVVITQNLFPKKNI